MAWSLHNHIFKNVHYFSGQMFVVAQSLAELGPGQDHRWDRMHIMRGSKRPGLFVRLGPDHDAHQY